MMIFNCYQCDKIAYLFPDSRCADCTRTQPEHLFDYTADPAFLNAPIIHAIDARPTPKESHEKQVPRPQAQVHPAGPALADPEAD